MRTHTHQYHGVLNHEHCMPLSDLTTSSFNNQTSPGNRIRGGKLKNSCNVELTKSGVPNGCAFPPLLKTRIIIKILVGYQVHFNAYSQIELCFVSNNGAPNFIFLLLNDDL